MPSGLPACRPASRKPGHLMPDGLRQAKPPRRAAPSRGRNGHATMPVVAASEPFILVEFFSIEVFRLHRCPASRPGVCSVYTIMHFALSSTFLMGDLKAGFEAPGAAACVAAFGMRLWRGNYEEGPRTSPRRSARPSPSCGTHVPNWWPA